MHVDLSLKWAYPFSVATKPFVSSLLDWIVALQQATYPFWPIEILRQNIYLYLVFWQARSLIEINNKHLSLVIKIMTSQSHVNSVVVYPVFYLLCVHTHVVLPLDWISIMPARALLRSCGHTDDIYSLDIIRGTHYGLCHLMWFMNEQTSQQLPIRSRVVRGVQRTYLLVSMTPTSSEARSSSRHSRSHLQVSITTLVSHEQQCYIVSKSSRALRPVALWRRIKPHLWLSAWYILYSTGWAPLDSEISNHHRAYLIEI